MVVAPRGNTGPSPDYTFAQVLTYDAQGNLVSRRDADESTTTYTYDAVGRRLTTVDPDGNAPGGVPAEHTWTTSYDAGDRITGDTDPLGRSTLYGYDGAGNRTSVTDRNANVTRYFYDGAARLSRVEQQPDPAGQPTLVYATTVTRDDNGNATSVTQANGVVTDYAYDELDRLSAVTTHPSGTVSLTTSYVLDGNGNVTRRVTADGVATNYVYDALSRLTGVSATGLGSISYLYDPAGDRTSMTDGTGTTTYAYDGLGRLTSAAQPGGTTSYGYDLDSNRTALTYPGASTVSYAYSDAGRLASLTDWAGRTATYAYTPAGLAASVTLPAALGGLVTSYGYDRAQRLTSLTNIATGATLTSHAYTLDNEGNRTALDDYVSGISAPGVPDHFDLTYDGLLRLTAVTGTNPEGFTLDAGSNLTGRSGPSATYSYDASGRLTSDGTRAFTWSDADRLTARGSDTFSYDPLDRLTASTVALTSRSYAYNGDGLLQSRTQGTSTAFLWDPATSPSRLLMQGGDKIVSGLGPLYAVKADGSTVTFARDGLGSVRAEVDATGAATASFRYRAYGEVAQSSGASVPTYLGYAGELVDPSGLVYMRARWYDPAAGRFITRDPLSGMPATPGTLNSYGYAGANPVLLLDPTGLAFSTGDDAGRECPERVCISGYTSDNWAYAIAGVFRDLDSSDPGTQAAALVKVAAASLVVAIPVGIAAARPHSARGRLPRRSPLGEH